MSSSSSARIQLAFVWHMHQPDYRNRAQKCFQLPWVRLHALKDYYDMPARLEAFPKIRQTFNLVPSLVCQMENYLEEGWSEVELDLFRKPAEQLATRDKHDILSMFFNAPEETLIAPYPRYSSLLRESRLRSADHLIQFWSEQEWRDLQVWRQLSWFDPLIRSSDRQVDDLLRQGQNYREEQKNLLHDRMIHWIREALAVYRRLQDQNQIEVSVTPFYHPILPLLIDPASAQEAMPTCPLPDPHGFHPEDARAQMEKSLAFYQERFGRPARGVWPSEGSVSQETAHLMTNLGVEWFASDEEILFRSLEESGDVSRSSHRIDSADLYRPYRVLDGAGSCMIFRDHRLSDLLGFEYQHWDPERAAHHFVNEILAIGRNWQGPEPPLVPVILDGENCWEYYHEDGGPFLDALYSRLSETPGIECTTVSGALADRQPRPLKTLSAGSWINGNFFIWMGEEADRKAWSLVETARRALVQAIAAGGLAKETEAEAWEEIFIAEGSDWFWWFGDTHSTNQMRQFDEMFRHHVVRVYELLGMEIPRELLEPLESLSSHEVAFPEPVLLSPPMIDGKVSHYYEWRAAVRYDPDRQGGAMRAAEASSISNLFYGGDGNFFYLRADPANPLRKPNLKPRWEIRVTSPKKFRVRFIPTPQGYRVEKRRDDSGQGEQDWEAISQRGIRAAEEKVFEACIPWEVLETNGEETLSFFVGISTGKDERMEMVPSLSCLGMTVPGKAKAGYPWFP